MSEEKKSHLSEISAFMTTQGISVEDILTFQKTQVDAEGGAEIGPSELEGTSNIVSMTNEQLTSELLELKRRFNNHVAVTGFSGDI